MIGAGLMGHGIAIDLAIAGHEVRLHDVSTEALRRAEAQITAVLERLAQLDVITTEEQPRARARIRASSNLAETVGDADLVIESATEDLETKRRIFADLDQLCPAQTILASNSSSLAPSAYASATKRPALVLGAHYFNPPYLLPCVELIPGPETAETTLHSVREFLEKARKQVVVLRKEVPGFIANRLQAALLREAMSLVEHGVAAPADIDAAVRGSIGRRFAIAGPFEIFDLAGLDTVLTVGRHLTPELESASTVSSLLESKVARGELGAKSGKGFYAWTSDTIRALQSRVAAGLSQQAQRDVASFKQREPFLGAWQLVSFEAAAAGQTIYPFGADATGLLIYTVAGRMSVILSRSNRPGFRVADARGGTAEEKAAAFESCFAYAGTFEVADGRVIHRLEQCTLPNWIGTEQVRFCRFEEDRLTLETPPLPMDGRETVSRLVWRRVKP